MPVPLRDRNDSRVPATGQGAGVSGDPLAGGADALGVGSAPRLGPLRIQVVADRPGVGGNLREGRRLGSEIDNMASCYLRYGSGGQGDNDLFILSAKVGALVAALMQVLSTGRGIDRPSRHRRIGTHSSPTRR